ncbi:MAG: hypothetical protein J7M38_05530, partial [Armatimonadetes bacterium]|nr:hypothetical protein [Armatimonadota bacterium]
MVMSMGHDSQTPDLRQARDLVDYLCERYGTQLSDDELEALADLLLRLYGDDEEYPCSDEARFNGHLRAVTIEPLEDSAAVQMLRGWSRPAPVPDSAPGVVQVLVARLLVAANLTSRRRRQVARLRLWGCSRRETARLLGLREVTVDTEWRYARRALREAMQRGRVDDMPAPGVSPEIVSTVDAREVARLEQRRCIYVRPT